MRHGDPNAAGSSRRDKEDFIRRAIRFQGQDCLLWPFAIGARGYGHIGINGKVRAVHRVVLFFSKGNPPNPNMHAAHSCGNTSCVNPNHLRWATHQENMDDKLEQGTSLHGRQMGIQNPHGLLSGSEVREIHRRANSGQEFLREIAAEFGVSITHVSDIKNNKVRIEELVGG